MLFKKKDSNESVKAKTSLFASKAKKSDAHEKENVRQSAPVAAAAKDASTKNVSASTSGASLKTITAAGKVNAEILRNPRITEKVTNMSSSNVYTFDVAPFANKTSIKAAVKDVYRVTPVAVRIVAIPTKRFTSRRGASSTSGGGKKAYVQLRKGDTIELV